MRFVYKVNKYEMDGKKLTQEKENLPSDVENAALEAESLLLPQKSRMMYEKEYQSFKKWKSIKNINGVSEKILLAYFSEKSKKAMPSSLWSYYSMLKRTLLVNENCDISKFSKLTTLLKNLSGGYKAKKSKILESDDIIKFLREAPDDVYLLMKVIAIFGVHGATRSDELYKLEVFNVDDRKSVIIVSLSDTKTKQDRSFCITDKKSGVSFLEIVRKYIALRPKNVPHSKFFVNYRQQKCTTQPVGINTIYSIPKKIADFLKLANSEMYTGHCFRRSSATMFANSGADLVKVKRLGGWKSSSIAESYIEESISNKIAVSKSILCGPENQPSTSNQVFKQTSTSCDAPKIDISNNVNCTISVVFNP